MKIQISKEQFSLINEQDYYYDKNDVRRTVPKNINRQEDETTRNTEKLRDKDINKLKSTTKRDMMIDKVRSKLIFYFDKTYDKIVQLEKDIIKEKYGSDSYTKTDEFKNPFKKHRIMDPNKVVQPKKIDSVESDRVLFSEKKVEELKSSLEYVKDLLKDEEKLLELYKQGTFSVEPHTSKNPQQKGGDPDTEPSRRELRKHMLDLRKKIETLNNKEDKSPQEEEMLRKYKEEYDNEFETGMMY